MKNKGKRKKTPSTGQDKACSMPSPNKKDKKRRKKTHGTRQGKRSCVDA